MHCAWLLASVGVEPLPAPGPILTERVAAVAET